MKHLKEINNIARRAHQICNQMIFMANHRPNKEKGDPKVGGHSSASSSAIHILGALHLVVRNGFDHIANKPHASPADHAYHYLLDLLLKKDLSKLSEEEAQQALSNLRAFSQKGEPVFQSYHSYLDPDHYNFFPSGTVGIPPVQAGYMALAYSYAKTHGYTVPDAHFWAIIGDSEFREGSLFEATPDFAEREIGNLTWIVDYNRQSLDGHRITNTHIYGYTDDQRIQKTMEANGWQVIQVQHGSLRQKLFKQPQGDSFQHWLEREVSDYELQALLMIKEPKQLKEALLSKNVPSSKSFKEFVKNIKAKDLFEALHDMGGHDMKQLVEAMQESKKDKKRPCLIIAHTIKGWGLEMACQPGNHSALPSSEEMDRLRKAQGLPEGVHFARFPQNSPEGQFLKKRGEELYKDILKQHQIKENNLKKFKELLKELPDSLDINLKMANYPHTQWMLGQLTSKLTRIANTPLDEKQLQEKQKPLTEKEKKWKPAAELIAALSPDVGTSTNLNPTMDGKIYEDNPVDDFENLFHVKDRKSPDLVPSTEPSHRFLRFEIAEANAISCMGSFGRLRDTLGIPLLPLMTVYDFFVKRALDQYFYELYWKSSFILCGTPSGVTLSPEGAQHGWKSDFQIPNQITWEPFFCQELDWIFCETLKKHFLYENEGRTGTHIRCVTRGIQQKDFLKYLKKQKRFKANLSDQTLLAPKGFPLPSAVEEDQVEALPDSEILKTIKDDVLSGAYYLIDYRGYANYEPGDNVVHIFAMGALGTEAIKASEALLEKGIYANVIIVTSPDLLCGNLAQENDYDLLKNKLQITSDLYLHPIQNGTPLTGELLTLAGRRVPLVSVHDGEPGLLDNLGSIVGVRHEALAVRKHSRCGRPKDIYKFHGIDADSVIQACQKVLAETALESLQISRSDMQQLTQAAPQPRPHWKRLVE